MKVFLAVVLGCVNLICARAGEWGVKWDSVPSLIFPDEEWGVSYTLPQERSWIGKIIPMRENIPYLEFDTFTFEGSEFYAERWMEGNVQMSVARYFQQWNIPETRWKLRFPELSVCGPSKLNTLPEETAIRFGFSFSLKF